jgi:hypothetical protein
MKLSCTHSLNDAGETCTFCRQRVPMVLAPANIRAAVRADALEVAAAIADDLGVQAPNPHLGSACWLCWTREGDALCRLCWLPVRAQGGCQCDDPRLGRCVEAVMARGA